MKKVLIFSLGYYPNVAGGAEPAIREITNRIHDIEFHLIANRYDSTLPKEEKFENIYVHRIGIATKNSSFNDLKKFPLHLNKPLYQFLAALKAIQLHRKYKFDAIWAVMAHSAGVPAALFKLSHPKVGYVLSLQEGDPPGHVEKVMKPLWPLFTRSFTLADVVQPISTFLLDWARRRGVPDEKIVLIYNGANPKNLNEEYDPHEAQAAANALGKKPGDVYLLNASRLVHQKGNDDTVRALQHLPENVHLVLIGTGEDEKMIQTLAKELKVESRLHLLGRMEREQVPTYRNPVFADIYVTPSRSEGLQLSSLSAMAARLPLIATQEGGLSEYVWDKKHNPDKPQTAWVVDANAPEQIAQKVMEILNNPDTVKEVVTTSRTMVETSYNWDNIAKDMRTKVFERVFNL